MKNAEKNKVTVTFGCDADGIMDVFSAIVAIEIGLPGAQLVKPEIDGMETAVLIDPAELGVMRAILSDTFLKNAFARAEINAGVLQTCNEGKKAFSVMISPTRP